MNHYARQVEWRNGSSTWVPLSELRESNPIEVMAEYAVANKVVEEPTLCLMGTTQGSAQTGSDHQECQGQILG